MRAPGDRRPHHDLTGGVRVVGLEAAAPAMIIDADLVGPLTLLVGAEAKDLRHAEASPFAAVSGRLRVACSWTRVEPAATSVRAPRSLGALLGSDVLCCCADRDSARLVTGMLAALYLKPLLDVGTGVEHPASGRGPTMGADVRLILPGEGCLFCQGGVANPDEARRSLASAAASASLRVDWRRDRAGSLSSLNQVSVGLGVRLLEDLVSERRREGAWLRLTFDGGRPALQDLPRLSEPVCSMCRYLGAGDAGRAEAAGRVLMPSERPAS